jgi:hypothetical protein
VIGAIINRARGKAKREKDAGNGASNHSKKKKNKQWSEDSLVAAAKRKGKKASTEATPDHFEKMLEGPCPNHAYPIKHAYKDCELTKKFLAGGSKKRDEKRSLTPEDNAERRRLPTDDRLPHDLHQDRGLSPKCQQKIAR